MDTDSSTELKPPSWDCDCCGESYHDYGATQIRGSSVCKVCIQQMFHKALKHEIHYPVAWDTRLHPKHFSHIMPADFIERYERKEKEYQCMPADRLYCQHRILRSTLQVEPGICGSFVGANHNEEENVFVTAKCSDCGNMTCSKCGEALASVINLTEHGCIERRRTAKELKDTEEKAAFEGLQQGKHWQFCPNTSCKRRVELSEACNHLVCYFCSTGFCFICGKAEDEESDHWRSGGCPRYNHPDDPNAEFDDHDPDEDEDSEESDDDEPHPENEEEETEVERIVVDGIELDEDEQADDSAMWSILHGEIAVPGGESGGGETVENDGEAGYIGEAGGDPGDETLMPPVADVD